MARSRVIADCLTLPAICTPMFKVSTPALIIEVCKADLLGRLPRRNADGIAMVEAWLVRRLLAWPDGRIARS